MKKILITGNLGYIGSVLSHHLSKTSIVVGLDNQYYTTIWDYYGTLSLYILTQHNIDIRDITGDILKGVDSIIHLAALSNDPLGELDGGLTEEINCKATVRLAELAKKVGIRKFIFSSSCSVYGKRKDNKALTERDDVKPLTNYAISKVLAEKSILNLKDRNFCPVVMRNATVYGLSPAMRLDLVVNNLVALGMLTGKISIMSDGTPWRPIIHVDDLCQAFEVILNAPEEKVTGQIFNIGMSKENWTVKEIADQIKEELKNCRVEILNKTGGDDRSYRVLFFKFQNTFKDFQPKWDLRHGIMDLIVGYKKNGLSKTDLENSEFFRVKQIKKLLEVGKLDKELRWTE